MNVDVVSCNAYSLQKQAELLAKANSWRYHKGYFNIGDIGDIVIIVCNPCNQFNVLIRYLQSKKQIWYMVTEGRFEDKELLRLYKRVDPIVVVPSKFAGIKSEESGIPPDYEVPNAIEYVPLNRPPKKDVKFLYIAGYLVRKYPYYARGLFEKVSEDMVVVTTKSNPFLSRHRFKEVYASIYDINRTWSEVATEDKIKELYSRSMFYLNISDSEGFGLTPLEASAFWTIPILPELPTFKEIFSDCPIWVRLTGEVIREFFPPIWIEHHIYDVNDMIDKALSSRYDVRRAYRCTLTAKKYYYKDVYAKFKRIAEELKR